MEGTSLSFIGPPLFRIAKKKSCFGSCTFAKFYGVCVFYNYRGLPPLNNGSALVESGLCSCTSIFNIFNSRNFLNTDWYLHGDLKKTVQLCVV